MTVFTKTFPTGAAFAGNGNAGLTKREYFAAQAMKGILASGLRNITFEDVHRSSVRHAEALIAELNKAAESEARPVAEPARTQFPQPFKQEQRSDDFIRGQEEFEIVAFDKISDNDRKNPEYMAGYDSMMPF